MLRLTLIVLWSAWFECLWSDWMVIVEWHYFTVVDEFTGLNCSFRWREAICDYCGVDYQFQLYCGLCGRYDPIMDFVDLDSGFEYCSNFDFRHFYSDFHVF